VVTKSQLPAPTGLRGWTQSDLGAMENDAPLPQRRPRRPPRFSQAEIASAFRAAQQVGREYGVRVEPDERLDAQTKAQAA
jgi:hypothetical protein